MTPQMGLYHRPSRARADREPPVRIPRYLVDLEPGALTEKTYDVLVVGSGIAGLTAALNAARSFSVCVLTKGEIASSTTRYAQGGVAVATAAPDSPRLHLEDTIRAGAGLVHEPAAQVLAEEGPDALEELVALGARFDRRGDRVSRATEGGHSLPRILHMGDATGSAIEEVLVRGVRAAPSIEVEENVFCLDLVTAEGRCAGVLAVVDGALTYFRAGAVILATGGAGRLYSVTTNPPLVTGDGMAMALRAGASLRDMEFIQFHPTALHVPENPRFLITEALRGEGACLVGPDGERFMEGVHPLADLAPRDVVVREMVRTMRRTGTDHVFLDARQVDPAVLRGGYPNIFRHCLEAGFDLTKDLVPVSFAAHFTIGGVAADLEGRTDLPGLFATGEVASNGLHGANRLASNSLLEGLVFSRRIVRALEADLPEADLPEAPKLAGARHGGRSTEGSYAGSAGGAPGGNSRQSAGEPAALRRSLGELMTYRAGAVRNGEGLAAAGGQLAAWRGVLLAQMADPEGWELQNLVTLAYLVVGAASEREETRGAHYREDFPASSEEWGQRNIFWRVPTLLRA